MQVPPLSEEKLYPKEQALVDVVAAERLEGRKVLVYVTHTGTRDTVGWQWRSAIQQRIRVFPLRSTGVLRLPNLGVRLCWPWR